MPVNFDLNDLYAFRALVEYGSFRIAAESICLSQSALSRRIEKLETAVGAKLFDRTTRRVTLTLFGQTFADRCGQLLENVETMLADIDKVSEAYRAYYRRHRAFGGLPFYAGGDPPVSSPLSARAHQAYRQQRGQRH